MNTAIRRAALALLLAITTGLAACGGGGDFEEDDSTDVPVPQACEAVPRPPACL